VRLDHVGPQVPQGPSVGQPQDLVSHAVEQGWTEPEGRVSPARWQGIGAVFFGRPQKVLDAAWGGLYNALPTLVGWLLNHLLRDGAAW
jgi:hypothetical protein